MEKSRSTGLKKLCSYHGCLNNSVDNTNLTFFAFPKDEERRGVWLQNAGITPAAGDTKTARFLCEVHFSNIYLCRSQRRTLLLQTATPFVWTSGLEGTVDNSDSIESMASNNDHEQEDGNKEHIETIPVLEDSLEEDEPLDEVNSGNDEWTMESQPVKLVPVTVARKRKNTIAKIVEMQAKVKKTVSPLSSIDKQPITIQMSDGTILRKARLVCTKIGQTQIQIPTASVEEHNSSVVFNSASKSVAKIRQNHTQSPSISVAGKSSGTIPASKPAAQKSPATSSTKSTELKADTHAEINSNDEPPVKQDQISEFIFKGEEYVQMPKAVYHKKLEVLNQKVAHYETIIQMMRDVMGQANDYNLLDS